MAAAIVIRRTFWDLEEESLALRARSLSDSAIGEVAVAGDRYFSRKGFVDADWSSDISTTMSDAAVDSDSSSDISTDEQASACNFSGISGPPGCFSRISGPPGTWAPRPENNRQQFVSCGSFAHHVQDHCTTVLLRKLPEECVRNSLVELLNSQGLHKCYDFVYLPTNLKTLRCFGYAIVNFISSETAKKVVRQLDGLLLQGQTISVEWSDAIQGLPALVEKYRNSAIMHSGVPEAHRPLLLCDGVRVPFPCATRLIGTPPHIFQKARRLRVHLQLLVGESQQEIQA